MISAKFFFPPKYFKLHLLSVLMTCLTIFSVPDFVFCLEGESIHMEATEHKYKTKPTTYLVSLIKATFKRLFYQFVQRSISFCSMGDFCHQIDNAARLIQTVEQVETLAGDYRPKVTYQLLGVSTEQLRNYFIFPGGRKKDVR